MGMTAYLREELIKHTLGLGTYTPSPTYLALLSGVSDDVTYTEIQTPGANGYTRVLAPSGSFSSASNGSIATTGNLSWAAALSNWGTARYIGLFNSSTTGNLLWYSPLAIPKFIALSSMFKIYAGMLELGLAGAFSAYLRNGVLNFLFKGGTLTPPATVYMGVGLAVDTILSSLTEPPTLSGYFRVHATSFASVANGIRRVSAPTAVFTATAQWGLISHLGLWDTSTAGNLLYALALPVARSISAADSMEFTAPNAVTVGVS